MGLIKIRFIVDNEVQLSRAFDVGRMEIKNLEVPYREMADDFFQSMSNVFAAEGAFEERTRWQDLSPAYAVWKARHFPGRKILERTGRLKTSLTVKGGPDNVLEITPNTMSVGTKVPYALRHQRGEPSSNLPMRKIIELTDVQRRRWVRIMHLYIHRITEEMARIIRGGIA